MTDSDKLKAITSALLDIVNIINVKDDEKVVEVKQVKKKVGRPKKKVVEPIEESKDVHKIIKNEATNSDKNKSNLIQMQIRTEPMKFIDNNKKVPLDKIDKDLSYIKANRTPRKKSYESTLVDCECDICKKTFKVDKLFAPKKFDSQDEGGLYKCDKCIKKKGF